MRIADFNRLARGNPARGMAAVSWSASHAAVRPLDLSPFSTGEAPKVNVLGSATKFFGYGSCAKPAGVYPGNRPRGCPLRPGQRNVGHVRRRSTSSVTHGKVNIHVQEAYFGGTFSCLGDGSRMGGGLFELEPVEPDRRWQRHQQRRKQQR
jgi:hypothetical protein